VRPGQRVFTNEAHQQPLRVTAHFSTGTSRDVTRQAVYQSNQPDIAEVTEAGVVQVKSHSGLFAIMVRYADQMTVFYGTVPHTRKRYENLVSLTTWEKVNRGSSIDRHLVANWKRLGVEPSAPASEEEFIRRVSLDICGTLPTPQEVKAYLADTGPGKRARLIDQLLKRPEYA